MIALAPTGAHIEGAACLVPQVTFAEANSFEFGQLGQLECSFTGKYRQYDTYSATDDNGEDLWQDEDGNEWPESAVVLVEPNSDEYLLRAGEEGGWHFAEGVWFHYVTWNGNAKAAAAGDRSKICVPDVDAMPETYPTLEAAADAVLSRASDEDIEG